MNLQCKVGADIKKVRKISGPNKWVNMKKGRIQEKVWKNSRKRDQSKKRGDLLYSHYSEVQNILV
jgi:hypothetical protein